MLRFARLIAAFFFTSAFMCAAKDLPSPYTGTVEITAHRIAKDFVPNGNLDKTFWRDAQRQSFDHDWSGQHHFPEVNTQIATLWTSKYLYVAFWCKYSVLNVYQGEDPAKERWGLWNRDVVEVFANPEPKNIGHYYEFEVAPNNQWVDLEIDLSKKPFNDAGWNSGFEHATQIDTKKHAWTCEMRIPIRSITESGVHGGDSWRVNFFRAHGLGDDASRQFLAWSPVLGSTANFHTPARFGLLRFAE
jgi:alpha-galactosidase